MISTLDTVAVNYIANLPGKCLYSRKCLYSGKCLNCEECFDRLAQNKILFFILEKMSDILPGSIMYVKEIQSFIVFKDMSAYD